MSFRLTKPSKPTHVLFLDVDGVLNRCGRSSQGLESEQVALLQLIIEQTQCAIVLSSTWRKIGHCLGRVHKMLEDFGTELHDITPVLGTTRGAEIAAWLEQHPEVTRFVILDDDADMGPLLPHLILTESFVGLTPSHAKQAIERLNAA